MVSSIIKFIKLSQHFLYNGRGRSVETEVGVDVYEEIIGDLDYSTSVTVVQGWSKKRTIFLYCITPVCDDVGRRSIYQNVQLFIRRRLLFRISSYLNILCTSSEKRYYTENANYFKHDVQLLHTIPSKLTNISDYEHQ